MMQPKDDVPDGSDAVGIGSPLASARTKRSRWATRKLTVRSSGLKRLSLVARKAGIRTSQEKKRTSAGSDTLRQDDPDQGDVSPDSVDAVGTRKLYFNLPLPDDLKDEDGNPTQQYARNKIRTAKYTPLSFIPKNLWFQFHNIANIFFLFIDILVVSSLSSCLWADVAFVSWEWEREGRERQKDRNLRDPAPMQGNAYHFF